MNTKLILLLVSLMTLLSFRVVAGTDDFQSLDVSSPIMSIQEKFPMRPKCDDDIYSQFSDIKMIESAKTVVHVEPIFVGGARYTLNKSNFNPVYETRVILFPCPYYESRHVTVLVGYEIIFSVDGDFGQDLLFDISGRSNKSMKLKAACGSFSASDSGTKWVISKSKNTNYQCKTMHLEFSFGNSTVPSYIDLNISISEQIQ